MMEKPAGARVSHSWEFSPGLPPGSSWSTRVRVLYGAMWVICSASWTEPSRSSPLPPPRAADRHNFLPGAPPMTTSEATDWMNHPAIRALVDQANMLALEERITLVKGLIPAIANGLSDEEY